MYCWLFIIDTGYEVVSNIEPIWDSQDRCYRCLDINSIEDIKPFDKPIKI